MLDLLYLVLTILFFTLGVAYVAGCNRLGKASGPKGGGAS